MWYQNRPQLQTGQFPLTQRVSSQWPRFNLLRDGQKLPKNRLWRICINTNCENKNDRLDYWSGLNFFFFFFNYRVDYQLPRPDQPDRLLRPCILLNKMYKYGIRGNVFEWMESYLSSRRQLVLFNYVKSEYANVTCGVPQGSIMGPLLFVLYVNDIANVSTSLLSILFADDTNVFLTGGNIDQMI